MAFGFSVGDFVALGNLILAVGLSLRDTSGSASQYRDLQRELDGLQRALAYVCLSSSSPRSEHAPLVAEIRLAVLSCRGPLQEFLARVQGYEGSLGAGKSRGKVADWGKKARWMMCKKEEEAGRLRAVLGTHVGAINMLLARQGVDMLEEAARDAEGRHRSLQGGLEESRAAITALSTALAEQRVVLQDQTSLLKQLVAAVTNVAAWFWRVDPVPSPDFHHAWFQPPVKFEDALGRVMPIASEYDYGMVAALIKERFKAGPGARLVEGEKYELFNTRQSGFPITRENWTAFLPGAYVKMAFVLEKRFAEGEGCPMPRCMSRTFTEAVGGGRCGMAKHTPQARVGGSLPHPQYAFDQVKLGIMNAIISGEVGKTYKEAELQIGPTPLDSTMAAEESREDAGAEEETSLFRNLKLREADMTSNLQLFSPRWHRDQPQYVPVIEKTVCAMTLEEVDAIRHKLSSASESQKEQWHQQGVDPLALYFRELAARSSPLPLGAARPTLVSSVNLYTCIYLSTKLEAWEMKNPQVNRVKSTRVMDSALLARAEQLAAEHSRCFMPQSKLDGSLNGYIAFTTSQTHLAWKLEREGRCEW